MKNNKTILRKQICFGIGLLALFANLLTGCQDENNPVEVSVFVKSLTQPVDNERIELYSVESLLFEWAEAEPVTNATVIYELLLDKADGNFTNPLKVITALNEGREPNVSLTKSELNNIAGLAGAGQGEPITLQWAVRAKNGVNNTLSEEKKNITLVRLYEGSPELEEGEQLYIAGQGAEAGQLFKKNGEGNNTTFEIYTRIEAGRPYYFCSRLNGKERTFSLQADGIGFRETTNTTPEGAAVDETAVYRVKVDFATATVSMEKIEAVLIRISLTGKEAEFTYNEKGVWELKNYNVRLDFASWGLLEDRYKIIFKVNGREENWGRLTDDSNRPAIDQVGYRDMAPTEEGQWRGAQFKFPNELCDEEAYPRYYTDIVLSMTADKNYTHDFLNYYSVDPKFKNSVFTKFSLPDPDVIRGDDGYFYLYATEHSDTDPLMKNAPIMRSADLMSWARVGSIFTDQTHPQITGRPDARIWAPTISKVGDKYIIYYSQPGPNSKHAIGMAISDHPAGPFENRGKLIDSKEQGVDLSIDAFLYQEDGRNYLFWGSFREINVIELTADGLAIKPGSVRKKVGGGQYEASYVHKKDGYYYLIVSTGNYAKGGTYQLVVGRSQNIMGPYVNKSGKDMIGVNHESVLKGNGSFSSPGHCSRIITDEDGGEWILYHAYPNDKNFRCLMLDKLEWVNGWPVVNGGSPSSKSYNAPVFNKK